MGDGGLSLVVHNCCILKNPKKPRKIKNMYLGQILDEEIRNELKKYRLDFIKPNNIEKKIAELLRKK